MKKIILLGLALAIILTSCAGGKVSDTEPEPATQPEIETASEPEELPASEEAPEEEDEAPEEPQYNSGPNAAPSEAAQQESGSTAKNGNPFKALKGKGYDLYLNIPEDLTYAYIDSTLFSMPGEENATVKALGEIQLLEQVNPPADNSVLSGFLVICEDYEKFQLNILKDSVEIGGKYYKISEEDYNKAKKMADEFTSQTEKDYHGAKWLVWMNPSRVTSISCTYKGEESDVPKEVLHLTALEQKYISAKNGKTYKRGSVNFAELKNAFITKLTFDNGVKYTVVADHETLYVESSDMDFGCMYQMYKISGESYIMTMQDAVKGQINPRTAKPVIYLYPETRQDISVKLDFKGELDYTYPAYENGWNITADPDGGLINKRDNSEHYYLYWDGTSSFRNWDLSKGFVVKGTEIEGFLREKLVYMGLSPREYNDFITYWTPILSKNKLNLISFSTIEYENIARLDITPRPETVIRVHMLYKAISEPLEIEEQILVPASVRKGFTVVEWGGTEVN